MHFLSIAVNQFIELATSGIFIQEKEMQEVQKKKIERRESVASVCRKKMKKAFSNNHFVSARIVKHVFLPFHLFLEMWNRKPEPMKRQKKISHY